MKIKMENPNCHRTKRTKPTKREITAGLKTAGEALNNFKEQVGKEIMRPDGNRAYLPVNLWATPIWLPENRAIKTRKFPFKWIDKFGSQFKIRGSEDIIATPDMGVLLGLAALFQDYMLENNVYIREEEAEAKIIEKGYSDPLVFIRMALPMSKVYKATGYTHRNKKDS